MKLGKFVPLSMLAFAAISVASYAAPAGPEAAPVAPAAAPAGAPKDRALRLENMSERMKQRAEELKKAPDQVRRAASQGKITFEGHKVGPKDPNHWGEFTEWQFTSIDIPGGDITKGSIEAEINIGSLKTDAEKLTGHLKTADFFDAVQFPKATISIKNAVATTKDAEGQHYTADGNLTIKSVSQPLKIDFVVLGEKPLHVKGSATVERSKFGVGIEKYSEANSTIAEKVPVHFDVTVPEKLIKLADKAEGAINKAAGKADEAATKAGAAAEGATTTEGATKPAPRKGPRSNPLP